MRKYPPPPELEGQRCWLLASSGPEGVATFSNSIAAGAAGGCLVGWVLFGDCIEYSSPEQFVADQTQHCVPPDSPYALSQSGGTAAYGWHVLASHRMPQPLPLPAMQRVTRSVYRLC